MANQLIGEDRQGGVRISSSGGAPVLEETYIFKVLADNKYVSRAVILSTPGLPRRGVTRSAYGLTVCKSISGDRSDENPRLWVFVCEFSSDVEEGQDSQDLDADPATWVPVYKTKFERLTEVSLTDVAGVAIANSAGQPFTSGQTVGRMIPLWEFYQFEPATVTDEDVLDRSESINDAEFKECAAKTLLIVVLSSEIGFYYGQRRRLTQYQLKYNRKKWTQKVLDVGTEFKVGDDFKAYTIIEIKGGVSSDTGIVINGPLNGAGGKQPNRSDPPAVLEFELFPSVDISAFLRV